MRTYFSSLILWPSGGIGRHGRLIYFENLFTFASTTLFM